MQVRLVVFDKEFQENKGKLKLDINEKLNVAINGATKQVESNMKGLSKFFTKHIKEKLKELSPNYPATGDLQRAETLVEMIGTTSTTTGDGVRSSFKFAYVFPRHEGVEYGYPLGDENTKFQAPVSVLAKWVLDKQGFYWTDSKGRQHPVTSFKQAKRTAFAMQKALYKERIKHSAPDWYLIDLSNSEIENRMISLNNLISAKTKAEIEKLNK